MVTPAVNSPPAMPRGMPAAAGGAVTRGAARQLPAEEETAIEARNGGSCQNSRQLLFFISSWKFDFENFHFEMFKHVNF